jgi:Zn ribbon nucleic-acid-binding protein
MTIGIEDLAEDTPAFRALAIGRCPACNGDDFIAGPRGGAAQNIECRACAARFNVTWFRGGLIFAQRIPSEAEGGSTWPKP